MDAINVWPEDGWHGALQAIPIYICAFGCHFNVLPVHGELAKPTRERLHRMVSGSGVLVSAVVVVAPPAVHVFYFAREVRVRALQPVDIFAKTQKGAETVSLGVDAEKKVSA